MSKNNCCRFKVTDRGVEIDSNSLPMANPTLSNYVARWFYENFPITSNRKIDVFHYDVLSQNTKSKVVISEISEGMWKPVLEVDFSTPEDDQNGLPTG